MPILLVILGLLSIGLNLLYEGTEIKHHKANCHGEYFIFIVFVFVSLLPCSYHGTVSEILNEFLILNQKPLKFLVFWGQRDGFPKNIFIEKVASAQWTTILPSKQPKSKMMISSPATLVLVLASFKWSN